MLESLYRFFSSLKLTFVLLCAATVLVFLGTMAQVEMGLYNAQSHFFRSLVVFWGPKGAGWQIPVFPGGYLIGTLLLINLATAHLRYYRAGRRKLGIALIHSGIVLLLLGQFATDMLQTESHMRLSEGETKNYSENGRYSELVVTDTTDPKVNTEVALAESSVAKGGEHSLPQLPLTVRVNEYYANAQPEFATSKSADVPIQGIGQRVNFQRLKPVTRMESRDVPAARVEVLAGGNSLGQWWVSNWFTEQQLANIIWRQASPALRKLMEQGQSFSYKGRNYQIAMRPVRYYKPYSLELVKFRHDKYPGTDIPKNFSSRVRILNPQHDENREVLIYMNHPLRYSGETYYQSGFDQNDPRVTILQVVRNPGWLTPYLACILVAVGMATQFLMHLFGFVGKWKTA